MNTDKFLPLIRRPLRKLIKRGDEMLRGPQHDDCGGF
jgi:hypothetical protein